VSGLCIWNFAYNFWFIVMCIGAILPNGEINWNCPCLGGMTSGPCGYEFREAFSCFHYSKSEPKGSDCESEFTKWQECMVEHMDYYGPASRGDDDEELDNVDIASFDDSNSAAAANTKPTSSKHAS
jgi:intermembrane space import and assembly protein 40